MKPTRIIQGAGQNSDELRLLFKFAAGNSRSAFGTKTALVFSAGNAGRKMVAQLSARQSKRLGWHQHCGNKCAARQLLAITTMAFEHHDWLASAFVTNRAACAAVGKRNLHERFLLIRNLSLNKFRQQDERFLPAEIARFGGNNSGNAFLHNVQFSSA